MSAIEELKASEAASSAWAVAATAKTNEEDQAASQFSTLLQKLQGSGTASAGDDASGQSTETITRIMADGSVRVSTYRDGKLISEKVTGNIYAEEAQQVPVQTSTEDGGIAVTAAASTNGSAGAASLLNFLQRP